MKVAISQPTYLPWLGYFDLIDQVDQFVFLDSVQFEKRSWQQRNRIKGPNGLILLTVPVMVKGRFDQPIAEAGISELQEFNKHRRSIEMSYRHARFFQRYWPDFCNVLEVGWQTGRLAHLNIAMIHWCMQRLSIDTPVVRSSEMPCSGKRGELLAKICEQLHADHYISVPGASAYLLEEEQSFVARNIEVRFQQYEHPEYEQRFPPFVPYPSVIDLIFNLGDGAIDVLRSGRRPALSVADMKHNLAGNVETRP